MNTTSDKLSKLKHRINVCADCTNEQCKCRNCKGILTKLRCGAKNCGFKSPQCLARKTAEEPISILERISTNKM